MRRRIHSPSGRSIAAAIVAIAAITAIGALAAVPPNLSKALEAQRRLLEERPQDAAVHNDLGSLLLLAGRREEAEGAYRMALELDPDKVSALFNLAQLLQQRSEKREALRLYGRVVHLQPNHAWAHYQIGTLHESWGQEARAVEHYARAFALDPQLAFKEVNPHIVENQLLTQAMLRAYEKAPGAPQAPRYFEERDRIVNLLVPLPQTAAQQAAGESSEEGAAGRERDRAGAAREGQNVIGEGDLQDRATGQAVPQGRGGRPTTRPQPTRPGLRQWERPGPVMQEAPGGEMLEEPGMQPGQIVTPPPGGVYYRPGSPSSGRLNIRVMPERDGEARG